jgi:hypothetical protein
MLKTQQQTVAAAEKVLADLQEKRQALVTHAAVLDSQRRDAAFAAHVKGDPEARRTLDKINAEVAVHSSELASVDDAIAAAKGKLAVARIHESRAADRAAAQAVRKELEKFREHGHALDVALEAIAVHGRELQETLIRMQQLGVNFPSGQQLISIGSRALLAACGQTPWRRSFETLPPRERYRFGQVVDGWGGTIENGLDAREKNEQPKESADAAA